MSPPTASPILSARGLQLGYRGNPILPAFDLDVAGGELLAVVGPNGGGKSTFLATVLGELPAVAGRVDWAAGVDVSFVAQRSPHDLAVPGRVADFVAGGLEHGWSFLAPRRRAAGRAIAEALEVCGAGELARSRLRELSEGQRQRVVLARALVRRPGIIVLDEPTAAMDRSAQRLTFELLGQLADEAGVAVVIATHQLGLAGEFAAHGLLLDAQRGVVLADSARRVLSAEHLEPLVRGWTVGVEGRS